MKKIIGTTLIAVSLFAVDYTSMSIDELANLRGSVPVEDRDAFKSAFQEKIQYLSPEEKIAYSRGKAQGDGTGEMIRQQNREQLQERTQQKLMDGSGSGGMYQGSRSGGFGGGGSGSGGGGGGGGRR